MSALPIEKSYNPDSVSFDQVQCPVCIESFLDHEIVTELGCRHIFHSHCIPSHVVNCPTCRAPIAGRVQHQVNIRNGLRTLAHLFPLFSDDPHVLNQRLAREAERESLGNMNETLGERVFDGLAELARYVVLGRDGVQNVQMRADALFLEEEMNALRRMNRLQRFFAINDMPQRLRFEAAAENPAIRTELSQRVIREHRTDSKRVLAVALGLLLGTLFYYGFLRTQINHPDL